MQLPSPIKIMAVSCTFLCWILSCSQSQCDTQSGAIVRNDYTKVPLATHYVNPNTDSLGIDKTSDTTFTVYLQSGDSLVQMEYTVTTDSTHENERKIYP